MPDLVQTARCAAPTRKYPEGRTGTRAGYEAHTRAGEDPCGECSLGRAREDRERKSAVPRIDRVAQTLQARHGMTLEQYDALLEAQGGGCAICQTTVPGGRFGRFHVDHDHGCCPPGQTTCGACVRGLLCNNCNMGIGFFGEDVDRLTAAVAYLMTTRGQA